VKAGIILRTADTRPHNLLEILRISQLTFQLRFSTNVIVQFVSQPHVIKDWVLGYFMNPYQLPTQVFTVLA